MKGFMVTEIEVTPNIDDAPWADLEGAKIAVVRRVCGIPNGTVNGKVAVCLAIELHDGRFVVAQTTLKLLATAVTALIARHGVPE